MNMRFFASLFVAFTVIGISGAQTVRMRVTQNSQALGTADFGQVLNPNGAKATKIQLNAKGPGGTLVMRENSSYDRTGRAIQKELTTIVNGKQMAHIIAKMDAKGANLVVEQNGSKQTKQVPLPKGAVTVDPSENWFVTIRPKVGTKVKSYSFSLNRLVWKSSESTYVGEREVKVGNRKVKGHLIREVDSDSKVEVIVDDKGMPLQMVDQNGLHMIRI